MNKAERENEIKYLDTVRRLLETQIEALRRKVSKDETSLEESGNKMWEELTHVIRDFDDVASLSIYNADLARQSDDYRNALIDLRNMLSLYRIPYFGRIDFVSDTDGALEKVYIGAHSFSDRKTFEPYIFDWRTPIASLFYDFGVGRGSFKSPGGTEHGEIKLKRRYKIRDGRLELLYDADDAIHDDMLGAVLSENAHARLKVIVESIQREQNRAIRDDAAGDFIIFGAAGSGKTSVGLHRFAYLLYRERERLTSHNFEIVSRNDIFVSYISDILPELGEEDARCTVFDDILTSVIGGEFNFEGYFPQIEYTLSSPAHDTRLNSISMKGSYEFLTFVNDYFKRFTFNMPEIRYGETILCSASEFTRRCSGMKRTRPFDAVISHAKDYAAMLLDDFFELNKKEILNEIWRSNGDYFRDEYEEEYIRRRRDTIADTLREIDRMNNLYALPLYTEILRLYAEKYPERARLCRINHAEDSSPLYYEDAVCVAYIKSLLGSGVGRQVIRHLLVDEAQDYNAFQHALLKKVYPGASFTILADPGQSVFPEIGIKSETELLRLYPKCHSMSLGRSYRSTGPICALASRLSGSITDYFDREGTIPRLILSADTAAAMRTLFKSGAFAEYETVGIITLDSARAAYLASLIDGAQLLDDPDRKLTRGTVILPAALCKGLEFDAVVIDCHGIKDAGVFYLLTTRALHSLYLVSDTGIPEALSGAAGFYEIDSYN